MKTKTYTTLALALAVSGCAWATEVVSSNVVGYSKITMNANGYTLIANPFVEVGTGDLLGINDMFANDKTDATSATSASGADNIIVWNGTQFVTLCWLKTNKKAGTTFWADSNGNSTVATLPSGSGALYQSKANSSKQLTVSGEVRTEPQTLTIVPGYNLIENPFPTSLSVQAFKVSGATAATSQSGADNIIIWNGNSFVAAYWLKTNKKAGTTFWVDSTGNETAATIDPFTSIVYQSRGNSNFTVTINPPAAAE